MNRLMYVKLNHNKVPIKSWEYLDEVTVVPKKKPEPGTSASSEPTLGRGSSTASLTRSTTVESIREEDLECPDFNLEEERLADEFEFEDIDVPEPPVRDE